MENVKSVSQIVDITQLQNNVSAILDFMEVLNVSNATNLAEDALLEEQMDVQHVRRISDCREYLANNLEGVYVEIQVKDADFVMLYYQ